MSDPHQAVQQLVSEARRLQNASEQYAEQIGTLLVGNLKRVGGSTLAQLKKELANYNIHTGRWKK